MCSAVRVQMKFAVALMTTLALVIGTKTQADTILDVRPNKCVAMNKGQLCYQKLRFTFKAQPGDYCLFAKPQKKPLQCWQNSGKGQFIYPFQSQTDIEYKLVKDNAETIACLLYTAPSPRDS